MSGLVCVKLCVFVGLSVCVRLSVFVRLNFDYSKRDMSLSV